MRIILVLAIPGVAFAWWLTWIRVLSIPVYLLLAVSGGNFIARESWAPLAFLFMLFFSITMMPIDTRLENHQGLTEFLPVTHGLAPLANPEKSWHAGCIVRDKAPAFMLVW